MVSRKNRNKIWNEADVNTSVVCMLYCSSAWDTLLRWFERQSPQLQSDDGAVYSKHGGFLQREWVQWQYMFWFCRVTDLLWIFLLRSPRPLLSPVTPQGLSRVKILRSMSFPLLVVTGFSVLIVFVNRGMGVCFAFVTVQSWWPYSVVNTHMPLSPRFQRQMWTLWVVSAMESLPLFYVNPQECIYPLLRQEIQPPNHPLKFLLVKYLRTAPIKMCPFHTFLHIKKGENKGNTSLGTLLKTNKQTNKLLSYKMY